MSVQESWSPTSEEKSSCYDQSTFQNSGFDPSTGIYHSLHQLTSFQIPTEDSLSTAEYALSEFPQPDQAETKIAFIDLATDHRITYAQLNRSIRALASGLYHALGVRKGDVVFVLSPNSILYPTISLAIFSIGAILSPAVPPVVLGLVKHASKVKCDLSSLRRVGSGAAPLSKELSEGFREKFPWVELRQGYGLTESSGAATFFASDEDAKAHPASCGRLVPTFCGKVVDTETGVGLGPGRAGEVWIKSPTIMKGYLGNEAATAATLEKQWGNKIQAKARTFFVTNILKTSSK